METTRVEKHIIKPSNEHYQMLDDFLFKSKNLYNYANYHVRQLFIICSRLAEDKKITTEQQQFLDKINEKIKQVNDNKIAKAKDGKEPKLAPYMGAEHKFISAYTLDAIIKGDDYRALPYADCGNQITQQIERNWKSFFAIIKDWSKNKDKYTGRPKMPNYLPKNGRNLLVVRKCKVNEGLVQFPKTFNGFTFTTRAEKIQQIRIIPRADHIVVEVVYKVNVKEQVSDNGRYFSIDIGIDNLATIVSNTGMTPVIINGKPIKSVNQYYNKQKAHYQEIAKRMNDLHNTKRLNRLTNKRNAKIDDYMHKSSKYVIELALQNDISMIVVGNNKDWKRESKLSKKVNQSFVGLPHQKFIEMIQYKAENVGIKVEITEESYTSGTSFLDGEFPSKADYNRKRRISRGMFKSNNGTLINSDANGAYQIMKKVVPNAYANGIEDVALHPVIVNL